jgi:hypothetical protein
VPPPEPTPEQHRMLDLTLTYLWRVHGIDYYGIRDLGTYERSKMKRTLRDPPPKVRIAACFLITRFFHNPLCLLKFHF